MEFFVQSPAWVVFQRSLGRSVHELHGEGWRFLAIEESNPAGKVLYLPYGPVAERLDALDAALAALRPLAKKVGAVFIRLEPATLTLLPEQARAALRARGMVPAPANQQPELTSIIKLGSDLSPTLAQMKPTNRNLYRNIAKKGVTFRSSQDPAEISILLGFLHETAQRNGFKPQSDSYLTQVAATLMPLGAVTLYLAELDGAPIGAALVYDSADTRVYAHAALAHEHRKLSAGIPLVVTLIAEAQAKGLSQVDLSGVAPEGQPEHKWAGFTAFKNSFGGELVEFPGTWDLPVNRLRYKGYQLARKARNKIKKLRG
ncbi:hypothetical protein RSal33209_3027 [Renibacterium salmoninarum ATCC 33209]|uniref:BioF2-like acetyltransferase domain-containing protein n=1 Tax=Renibacterium salmoninarum (strain ATCC 33209 / DSM 20767 / JCM 11484 / NBRC 15589 / NCIMB 2235) TaxID=288705 RepID=A9WU77_RENSM|nr:peptidoglycan bridge formation glycyltransferase FemA/FemB family protein [Renibacterium salmoninarum]ABY24748.1 hypothetical protein RSal33209_3027 [Renibacterium salmoninarum ATCC 33209]